jgi:hypothetical protein
LVKTYSVSEIAERIGRPGEDMRVVGDRIRNWTREGLLDPVGMKNPGTGRSRLYPETALFDALVLTVITEAVGLQVVKVHLFRDIFAKARQYLADPRYSKKTFLVISRHMTFGGYSTQFADPAGLASLLKTSDAEGHIIIDLSKITKKLNP